MMRNSVIFLAICSLAATACVANEAPPETAGAADDSASCKNEPLAAFIGQTASAEVGAKMLAASGARTLRWGPPRSAMTMDFRPDRLTVSYDDNMVIDRASCG